MTASEKEEKLLRVIHKARFLTFLLGNVETADYELIDVEKTPLSEEAEQKFKQRGLTYLGAFALHDDGIRVALEAVIPEEEIPKISARFLKFVGREINERAVMERFQRLTVCPVTGELMIPPLPIERYPENTLEGLIAREWVSMIRECEDHTINLEPITVVISKSRALMRDAGWPPTYEHNFLLQLRKDLTELTLGHPVTRQFIQVLTIELEFN